MQFPPIEPFATGYLSVSDGNEIYWEASGNPGGKPALYLHGGPGSGLGTGYRRNFDPAQYLIVSLDQRGCGRSRPLVSDALACLATNTTHALIADLEALREHLGIDAWLVTGLSWGTTLALAYAEAHPDRVTELVLGAVTTTSPEEVEWITESVGRIFPEAWDRFAAASGRTSAQRVIDAYYERVTDPDPAVRAQAALDWCAWEDIHVSLDPNHTPSENFEDPQFRTVFASLVIHYWKHSGFAGEGGLLAGLDRISHIPGVLIHGRMDVSGPVVTAWELHKRWPGSQLIVIEGEGHGGKDMIAEVRRAYARFAPNAQT
jgi:proline iminopeptidase